MTVREYTEFNDDVRQIELVTDDSNDTIAFYKSLGFKELKSCGCVGFIRFRPKNG